MTTVTFISPYQAETFIAALGVNISQGQSIDVGDDIAATLLSSPLVWAGTLGVSVDNSADANAAVDNAALDEDEEPAPFVSGDPPEE